MNAHKAPSMCIHATLHSKGCGHDPQDCIELEPLVICMSHPSRMLNCLAKLVGNSYFFVEILMFTVYVHGHHLFNLAGKWSSK